LFNSNKRSQLPDRRLARVNRSALILIIVLTYLRESSQSVAESLWLNHYDSASPAGGSRTMKNLSKRMLAVLATGVVSCAVFSQQAQAQQIEGDINFAGGVQFDTNSLATATRVVTWFDSNGNAGFSTVQVGSTVDFAGIAPGTQATMAQPWIFNPSTPTPGLWSVGGFTFDLLTTTVVSQSNTFLNVLGTGIISGNGLDPTPGTWSFTDSNSNGNDKTLFSFAANAAGIPEPSVTVLLLGTAAIGALGMARRFLMG
jgi:hypothetical protein